MQLPLQASPLFFQRDCLRQPLLPPFLILCCQILSFFFQSSNLRAVGIDTRRDPILALFLGKREAVCLPFLCELLVAVFFFGNQAVALLPNALEAGDERFTDL